MKKIILCVISMDEQALKDTLAKNTRFFRFHKQLSQSKLAEKAGISITFLSNIERGNKFPKAGTLCNLADALEIEVWELFKSDVAIDRGKLAIGRLTQDVKTRVEQALDEVFHYYTG